MSGIRSKDTHPELLIRKGLHSRGFRFRLHDTHLPGKPDIVFPKYRSVIFVHGCFWHGHDCHLFKWPSSRDDFWKLKISRNKEKDTEVIEAIEAAGWRFLIIWECALKGKRKKPIEQILDEAAIWIKTNAGNATIRGY